MGGRRREKDLEAQLEDAKAAISALISGQHDGLMLTDAVALLGPEGRVSYVSPAITTILGHRPADLTGKRGIEFLHPVDRKRMRKLFARSIWEGAVPQRDEVWARHADGSWRDLELSIVSRLEDASVDAMVVTLRDVTARKQDELVVEEERDASLKVRASLLEEGTIAVVHVGDVS